MNTSITSAKRAESGMLEKMSAEKHHISTLRKVLLFCGMISSFYYVALNIIVPMYYTGYSVASQTVSELSAIDAPTRQLWVLLSTFYTLLVIAFSIGVWLSAGRNHQLRIAGFILFVYGFSGFFWPPMHQREVLAAGGGTFIDTMHIIFSIGAVLFMMLMMGFGAAALEKRFRHYTIVSFVLFVVFGTLTGLDGPKISENLPTPWIGVWERINIGIFMLWVIVFTLLLLWKESKTSLRMQIPSI